MKSLTKASRVNSTRAVYYGVTTDGGYTLNGTLGQPDAGTLAGGNYQL